MIFESHYPEKLLEHLKNVREYTVEEKESGIYTVFGDILPIQIIDSRKLSNKENLWLKDLCYKLDLNEIKRVLAEIRRQGENARAEAYLDAISRANYDNLQEALNMSNTYKSFEQLLREVGFIAKWQEREALAIAQNMVNMGLPQETIVSATNLDPEKVKALYQST